jgi:predicted metal-dependent hydrolase
MTDPQADPRFVKGIELFDEREYFECHEVIEALWLETPEEDRYRDLYKGVIQAAAAIYQLERGILSGALGLYRTSTGYLQSYRPAALGLDIEKILLRLKEKFRSYT